MQGLILAAGMGRRLGELTKNNPKCMVTVNGVTLIERMLRQLEALHLSRVVIVVGYRGQQLIDYIATLGLSTPITYINNPIYDRTNNIYSLALAKDHLLSEDTLLLESDVIFDDSVLHALADDPRETLALVDKYECWMDGTCVTLAEDDSISSFVPGKRLVFSDAEKYYKTVNIYKFSRHFSEAYYVPFLEAYSCALGNNEYYEQVLRVITMLDEPEIRAKKLTGQLWYEIDDIQDLDIASSMFETGDEKVAALQARFGGYWRYPHMLDFCYLVNPYYPPKRLMDEMKASFEKLLTQYPSGMRVNSLLAAHNFGVHQEHILLGNGAAELIKSLLAQLDGKLGFVRPTFEEYPNRYDPEKSVVYTVQSDDLSYTADDLMRFFEGSGISTLVLINPDNPSGSYIPKADVLRLCAWCRERGIRLLVDESFADFADEPNASLLSEATLCAYPNLLVMKSVSKSYGVPGIRLGVLAAADEALIERMKKDVAIWNINSFGEFYMQIAEKYCDDYTEGLRKLRAERTWLTEALSAISGLRVIPSQANYLLVELTNGMCATALTKRLLLEYDLLIKDLSRKIRMGDRQFVRLAVRDRADNLRLVAALTAVLA